MNSNQTPANRTPDSSQSSNAGSYQSLGSEAAASLKVPLSEHLDQMTRQSLEHGTPVGSTGLNLAKRNPIPLLLGIAGTVCLVAWWTRRSASR